MSNPLSKYTSAAASVVAAVAVGMMAVAAHALPEGISASARQSVETAGVILLISAVGTIALRNRGRMWVAKLVVLAGALLFSASIYARHLGGWEAAGGAAPAGGLCLIAGWLLAAWFMRGDTRPH